MTTLWQNTGSRGTEGKDRKGSLRMRGGGKDYYYQVHQSLGKWGGLAARVALKSRVGRPGRSQRHKIREGFWKEIMI